MTATREERTAARYGRSADARTDRKLKIVGAVLGAALLAMVGWAGVDYVSGQSFSGELIKFKVASDTAIEAHLEIRKDADTPGVCTLRALSEDTAEVGWKDFRFDERKSRVDQVVTVRTTQRAAAVELVGCKAVSAG
jgi:hypothetical protein